MMTLVGIVVTAVVIRISSTIVPGFEVKEFTTALLGGLLIAAFG